MRASIYCQSIECGGIKKIEFRSLRRGQPLNEYVHRTVNADIARYNPTSEKIVAVWCPKCGVMYHVDSVAPQQIGV